MNDIPMNSNKIKFIYFGTPEVASKTLQILKEKGYIPKLIITSPDSRTGRGLHKKESAVAIWSKINNIECLKPEKIDDLFIKKINNLNFDLSIVVAYGKILPNSLINTPKLGTINIHYSLLPKYRGASPLEASLLNGDNLTGISIQQMEYKLDSGPIILKEIIPIKINDTKLDLLNKLIDLGATSLSNILPKIYNKEIKSIHQDNTKVSLCKKIKKSDGEIDLNKNPMENWNKYRAYYGWPGIFYFVKKNNKMIRVKISLAIYENNLFVLKKVIPEGKNEMNYDEFLKWIN